MKGWLKSTEMPCWFEQHPKGSMDNLTNREHQRRQDKGFSVSKRMLCNEARIAY